MAGIGFKLQKLFQEDYFSSRLKAYSFAGLVTSGPWLIVILSISLIQWLSTRMGTIEFDERLLFVLSVSYCFIFSQVIFGLQQFVVTRYVADLFYEKQFDKVFPAFIGMSKVTLLIASSVYCLFFLLSPLPFLYKLVLFILFITINMIWVLFLFLSAAKFYQAVAYSFLGGGGVAVLLTFLAGLKMTQLTGGAVTESLVLLSAFTAGMIITLFGLLFSLFATFPDWRATEEYTFLSYFDRYPALFITGFLYNTGIWICNWIIWFGEGSGTAGGSFIYNQIYDTAIFWSYLTIIPTLILFVVSVETRFYERYRTFFGFINYGGTYKQIQQSKAKMLQIMKTEIIRLIRTQAVFTLFFIVTAGFFVGFIGMDPDIGDIFRITAIGAFSNAIMLVLILLLLYFEDQKGAAWTSVLFFSLNALLTLLLLPLGSEWYGFSFALGSSTALLFAGARLLIYTRDIEFRAFTRSGERITVRKKERFSRLARLLNETISR